MYARTVSGAKTATMTIAPIRVDMTSALASTPVVSRRAAVTRCEIGLTPTNHSRAGGRVSAGTNAFERKVSGNRIRNEMP